MPAAAKAAASLDDLRQAYRASLAAGGGRGPDPAVAKAFIEGLEGELSRLSAKLNRSGTVYHAPKVPKS